MVTTLRPFTLVHQNISHNKPAFFL
jgi:hypothetical protein